MYEGKEKFRMAFDSGKYWNIGTKVELIEWDYIRIYTGMLLFWGKSTGIIL